MSAPSPTTRLCAEVFAFVDRSEGIAAASPARPALARRALELAGQCRAGAAGPPPDAALASVGEALAAYGEALASPNGAPLREPWSRLAGAYEQLAVRLRAEAAAPPGLYLGRVKPRNLARNLFHIVNGLVSLAVYEWLLDRWAMVAVGATVFTSFVALDLARRRSAALNRWIFSTGFGRISRPIDAHATPSSTWYAASLTLGTAFLPKTAIELGAVILTFADPAAAWVGRRFGRHKLYRDRTAAGTLAFVAVGALTALGFLLVLRPEVEPMWGLRVALAAALAGAAAELFGDQLEDNFTIPLAAGGVAAMLLGGG